MQKHTEKTRKPKRKPKQTNRPAIACSLVRIGSQKNFLNPRRLGGRGGTQPACENAARTDKPLPGLWRVDRVSHHRFPAAKCIGTSRSPSDKVLHRAIVSLLSHPAAHRIILQSAIVLGGAISCFRLKCAGECREPAPDKRSKPSLAGLSPLH